MKVHLNRKLIRHLGILLLAAGLAELLAWKSNKFAATTTSGEAASLGLLWQKQLERFHHSSNQRNSSGRKPDVRKDALAMKERMLAKFPALRVEGKPVPDDQNAFRMLVELDAFIMGMDPPLSDEFRLLLKGDAPWDADAAKRFLTEHAELVERIEKIAALETRSSENMPASYNGFFGARSIITASEILLLKARLAAETGDGDETFRFVSAASNLGAHLQKIESPTVLRETVHLVIDLNIKRATLNTLLPALGQNADLSRWKSTFAATSHTSSNLAQAMRGEWNTAVEHMVFPGLIADERNGNLPDAEAVAHAYSSLFNAWVTQLPTLSLAQIESFSPQVDISHLSDTGREFVEGMIGFEAWGKGYLRSAIVSSQLQAALDLLILEQTGTPLSAIDAALVTQDPMSGQPFVFDPVKRELHTPEASSRLKVDPLVLPW